MKKHLPGTAELDALLEEILTDAHGDDEQLWAFRQAFGDNVPVPADAWVMGEPVTVVEIDYDGNPRRGLTVRCRREDGSEHPAAALEVVFPEGSSGARHVAAYRSWAGVEPYPARTPAPPRRNRPHKATADDVDLEKPVELVVLSVKERAARGRLLGSDRVITLRARRLWDVVPGEIVTIRPHRQWNYAGHPYLSGDIEGTRLDAAALGFVPLRLEDRGLWNPQEEYWGEEGEPIEKWAEPIIARGMRSEYEMEQVLPGADPESDSDPITDANDLKDAGDGEGAHRNLMGLLDADLRCLDAHAHLGNLVFDHRPKEAIRHYEVGLRIGELSLGDHFDGLLPWGHIDNRPFLRCMHGYGLCLWRLGRFTEAERLFERMLWLSPSDNQGARFLLADARSGKGWTRCVDEAPQRAIQG